MKSLKIILIVAIMTAPIYTFAQHQHQSVKEMMNDKSMQDSIMTMICNNPMMMENMKMHIMKNKEAMHSMMQQMGMMKGMMDMTDKDSNMSHNRMNMMMHHPQMTANNNHFQMNENGPLMEPGNEIFGTIQEVVQKLEADPKTDWAKVNLEALRQHLLDMKAFTEEVSVISQKPIENGIMIQVKPETERANGALKRLFKMHPAMLKMEKGWDMITKQDKNQWIITVTTNDKSGVEEIRALGYIGLLADGAHHQYHHWMIATGQMKNHEEKIH